MDKTTSKIGSLVSNLATFLYLIHDKGVEIQDPAILAICTKIDEESQKPSLERAVSKIMEANSELLLNKEAVQSFLQTECGEHVFQSIDIYDLAREFMAVIEKTLSNKANFAETLAWLQLRIPQIKSGFSGESRGHKLHAIRHYGFQQSLPWLALIAEKTENGLEEQWIMVEKITDIVHCMDPNPWDDIEEETEFTINDFMVRWELCGCAAIFLG